jgi:DNA-binding NarL/FixJ family response regulator
MGKIKVLIIEDAKLIRDRLVLALAKLNDSIEIYLSSKMSEAFVGLIDHHPNIIVLDLSLPDGNGMKILEKVKKDSPNTVVIVLTNFPFPQVRKRCKQLGADYFFSKENEFDEVFNTIGSIVHKKNISLEFYT